MKTGLCADSRRGSTLVLGATDTTSSGLARILHLLAIHQDVQEKLRSEILEHCEDHRIPFDSLETLPYLDAVCRETLRLWAVQFLANVCNANSLVVGMPPSFSLHASKSHNPDPYMLH